MPTASLVQPQSLMPLSTTTNRGSRLTPSMEYVVWDMEYGISIDACKEEEEVVRSASFTERYSIVLTVCDVIRALKT